jgi:hypothetical protein
VVTRHLRALVGARLLGRRQAGRAATYRVIEPVLHGLVACMEECSR